MGKRFLHSVAVQNEVPTPDGIYSWELGVNPLSHLLLGLRPLNDTGTLANMQSYLGVCGALNRVSLIWRGETIVSMSGRDLAAMNYFRHGIVPPQCQHDNTNNERRLAVLPMIIGNRAFNPDCAFPATRRGELTLEIDVDIADTGYDAFAITVEQVELLDAKPKTFERKQVTTRTWPATGPQDLDWPPGRECRGVLLFGTTSFGGASPAPSWGRMQVMMDGQQILYSSTDWEVAHSLNALWGRQPPGFDAHKHIVTTDGNAQTELATLAGPYDVGSGGWENYVYLDFDPTQDDMFTLDAKDAKRLLIRSEAETADAVRIVPVEVMPASHVTAL